MAADAIIAAARHIRFSAVLSCDETTLAGICSMDQETLPVAAAGIRLIEIPENDIIHSKLSGC